MLSIPDFKEKQFLFIDASDFKKLSLKNDNLLIKDEEDKIKTQVSIHKIFVIFVIWDFSITTKLINKLVSFWIAIYVLWFNLKPKFMINSPLEGNYLLRQKQYDCKYELDYSKQTIKNKTLNQLELLKQIRKKDEEFKKWIKDIKKLIDKIDTIDNKDSLRWIEWNIAKIFFITYFKDIWWFKRMPRTKVDITNLLMDIWYTYLFHFIEANLNLYGFDIYKWVFHTQFFERKSLVCDLQEPFRCIIDKKIRKMYNLNQIDEKDFKFYKWAYMLSFKEQKKYTALFLEAILEYKIEIFKYIKSYYLTVMKWEKDILPFYIK